MLGLRYIQENKKSIINGIKKRGIDSSKIIEKIIDLDKKRKEKQTELDNHLANSNKIAKEIGTLFKTGETEKVSSLKEKSIKVLLRKDIENLTLNPKIMNKMITE